MFGGFPVCIEIGTDLHLLDQILEELPKTAGVYALWPSAGVPFFGRTGSIKRRFQRLLRHPYSTSRPLFLREFVTPIEYRPVASPLESNLVLDRVAEAHMPDS